MWVGLLCVMMMMKRGEGEVILEEIVRDRFYLFWMVGTAFG